MIAWERHDEVELTIVGLGDFVDGANVGVVERGGGASFLAEPLLGGLIRYRRR